MRSSNTEYDIKWHALKTFKNYLQDREQSLRINGYKNEHNVLKYGVSQGTVFGPILFLIYVNDNQVEINRKFILFGDDIVTLFRSKSWEKLK